MKWISTNTTAIYALLILTGYINYYTFYSVFDLGISTYLTSGELLLSFLPLTIPIIGLVAFSLIFLLNIVTDIATQKETRESITDASSVFHLKLAYKYLAEDFRKIKSKKFRIGNVLFFIIDILNLTLKILGILYFIFFFLFLFISVFSSQANHLIIPIGFWIILSLFWFVITDNIITVAKTKSLRYTSIFQCVIAYSIFLSLITMNNRNKAWSILNGTTTYSVTFNYKNCSITTDSNFIFIGKTSNYLFFRDLKKESNKVYNFSLIEDFQISKNKKAFFSKIFY